MKKQTFNDGILKIYTVKNIAPDGEVPVEGLDLLYTLRYKERTVGIRRYYAAQQSNFRIDKVLRCPKREVNTECVAIPNDGQEYVIRQVQYPENIDPPVMDLSLEKRVTDYDID